MGYSNLEISQVFRQQKRLILVVTLLFTCFCALFIYQHQPIYRAKVILAPLTELDSSFQNVSLMNYFEISKEKNFNLTEIYNLFTDYLNSSYLKKLFYANIYFPSLKQSQLDRILNNAYQNFFKIYDIQLYQEDKQRKYTVSARATSSKLAVKRLNQYVTYANQEVFERLALYIANRKRIVHNALYSPITPLKANFYQSDNSSLNFKIFNLLSKFYDENHILFNPPLTHRPMVDLFRYDSSIILYNTNLEPRLSKVLCLGLFGGLILGFLIGAFRIGLQIAF